MLLPGPRPIPFEEVIVGGRLIDGSRRPYRQPTDGAGPATAVNQRFGTTVEINRSIDSVERRGGSGKIEGVLSHLRVVEPGLDDLDGSPRCPAPEPPGQRCSGFDSRDRRAMVEQRYRGLAVSGPISRTRPSAEAAAFGERLDTPAQRSNVSAMGIHRPAEAILKGAVGSLEPEFLEVGRCLVDDRLRRRSARRCSWSPDRGHGAPHQLTASPSVGWSCASASSSAHPPASAPTGCGCLPFRPSRGALGARRFSSVEARIYLDMPHAEVPGYFPAAAALIPLSLANPECP